MPRTSLVGAFLVTSLLGVVVVMQQCWTYSLARTDSQPNYSPQLSAGVSRTSYEAIQTGMTLEQVQRIMAEPGIETDGYNHPFCDVSTGTSILGTWRVWRTSGAKDRWIAAKFGHFISPDSGPAMVIEKMQQGL